MDKPRRILFACLIICLSASSCAFSQTNWHGVLIEGEKTIQAGFVRAHQGKAQSIPIIDLIGDVSLITLQAHDYS